jgi:peptidyl-prolyl cis-trans isomerase B (cyclophilin B)
MADGVSARPTAALGAIAGALALIVALALGACGGGDDGSKQASSASSGCRQVEAPPAKRVSLKPPQRRVSRDAKLTATVATSCGSFGITLDAHRSPKTVSSFVHLADEGAYNGTTFNRVVPDFLIQGGQVSGASGPGYMVKEPPPPDTVYRAGTVAMVKAVDPVPGSSGSQFFVVTAPADAGLPPDYAVLGHVSSGEDTVKRIAGQADPDLGADGGAPLAPIVIDRVTVAG